MKQTNNLTPLPEISILEQWMDNALEKAWQGVKKGESPFGAAIYRPDGEPVCLLHNSVRSTGKLTRHAEMNAIDGAGVNLERRSLSGLILVTTAEPCPMCAATAATAGIRHIVYGATAQQVRAAGIETLMTRCKDVFLSLGIELCLVGEVKASACEHLLDSNK